MRFSPLAVSGRSVVPVWRPFRDHSVSPWRTMKQRGAIGAFLFVFGGGNGGIEFGIEGWVDVCDVE